MYKAYKKNRSLVTEEIQNPKLIFHPAYPASDHADPEYAHPFIYECKLCEEKIAEDYLEKVKKNPSKIDELVPPNYCEREKHLLSMKSLGGNLVIKKDGCYTRFKGPEYLRIEAVGMSKRFKKSEIGMIYNYICLAPGSRFKGMIVDLNGERLQKLGYLDGHEYELSVGRGGSRGMGHIKVEITEEGEDFIKFKRDLISQRLREESPYLFLKAKSPIYGLSINKEGLHISSHLEIPGLVFMREWITGAETISGFSLLTGYPKAIIKAARPGSLYLYRVSEESWIDLVDILMKVQLTGLEPFNHLGLNMLEVV